MVTKNKREREKGRKSMAGGRNGTGKGLEVRKEGRK